MGKVLVSASHYDTLCREAWKLLEEHGHQVIYDPSRSFPAYSQEELKIVLRDVDAAVVGLEQYTEEVFAHAPKLKAVAKFGVGTDNIDCQAAARHGVKVLNAPGMNANGVAELTLGLMIDLFRGIVPLHNKILKGEWPRYMGREIKGKRIGLLGFGAIGQLVAEKLRGFSAEVYAYDLYPNEERARELGVTMAGLEEIIETCDAVSIHIPPSKESYHMFDGKLLDRMKDGAYLINAARGALVDLEALAEKLKTGKLSGAALDAFEVEPLDEKAPILSCENVLVTPHTGGETYEAYRDISLCTAKDIIRVLNQEEPVHWVNKSFWEEGRGV